VVDSAAVARVLLTNAMLLDPERQEAAAGGLLVEDGRIHACIPAGHESPIDARHVDLGGRRLAPGFIDLHLHGDLVFAAADAMPAALHRMAASLLRHGTTAFLATTVAWEPAELTKRVRSLADALDSGGFAGATPLGIHLEGPWLNPAAAGAQPVSGIGPYDAGAGPRVLDDAGDWLRMVTLAPEVDGASALLAQLAARRVVAALGHSLAPAETIEAARDGGLTHVTHLFNAMGGMHHRSPGVAGCVMTDSALTCDLICDGAHVDPRMVRVAAACLGERLVLISDRIEMPPRGSSGVPHSFGSGAVRDDGTALRLADGRLAGSSLQLDRALRNAVAFGALSEIEAVAALTLRPARVLGIETQRGTLRPGARADFAVLDGTGCVVETWLAGERVDPV